MDPEMERYRRKYPTFPGVKVCVELLRRGNVQGAYLTCVLSDLEAHAATSSDALILAFKAEQDQRVRVLLIGVMAETGLPVFEPLFIDSLQSAEDVRRWAVYGLKKVDTKEARRALWEAQA